MDDEKVYFGYVDHFNKERGFGVAICGDGEMVFLHISEIQGNQYVDKGQKLKFCKRPAVPGKKPRAFNVQPLG